ncbi:MAG: DUF6164 family protein [Cellvibrionaceae bacterium]
MKKLLIKLNNVPEDEANEIRSILSEQHIAYYETYAGTFGIGVAGIWLQDHTDFEKSKMLLDEYAQQRLMRAKAEQREAIEKNQHDTFFKKVAREPFKIFLYLLAIGFILYISVVPFVQMAFD